MFDQQLNEDEIDKLRSMFPAESVNQMCSAFFKKVRELRESDPLINDPQTEAAFILSSILKIAAHTCAIIASNQEDGDPNQIMDGFIGELRKVKYDLTH